MIFLFLQELGLFVLTQLIGIFVALRSRTLIKEQDLTVDFTVGQIIVFLVLLILFVYFIRKFSYRSAIFFRLILGIAIFAGSQAVLSLIFRDIISTLIALFLALAVLKFKMVLLHNIGIVLALAGIGAVLGLSLTPISVILLLLILSFYDIIAVYKTGHMIKMAQDMIKSKAIFGLILPRKLSGWGDSLESVQPGGEFMILGSGDVVMPLILIASVIGLHGLTDGLIVLLFSLIGLFLTYYLFITQKTRRPMAALPPIAAASIVGYLVALIL